ncbi:hypothetical protein [Bacillus massiliigorillae]|uniref:hypothetical protein n=1 Tax=Bacillus massiliigorillae TaxID=1243664 RepID=UPI0003A4AE4C|nr:hypothetical protein [Bacillus massiliigorillae]
MFVISTINKILKWLTFLYEGFLAIPILGGTFIIANGWTPLVVAGILHTVAIVLLLVDRRLAITGNVVGLLGALLGWIPIIGWLFHGVTAFILFIEAIYVSVTGYRSSRFI